MPDERRIRALSDQELAAVSSIVLDELRTRAFDRVELSRWTVGKLRSELANLPEDLPLLVNVHVEEPSEAGDGFIPLVITGGGFGVLPGEDGQEDEILPIYNIETEPVDRADGRLIWVVPG
ncbi:MAG TPA: hypothetical protein VFU35_14765 [Jatrophihabitans sp.]|nr:hypothetical protein [Jatrophihabitans sp.]